MEPRFKYPRTFHLPYSPGVTDDDKILTSVDMLLSSEVVITEKMDGECSTLYRDGMHARSTTYTYHESRSWLVRKHAEISYMIPNGIRICGESLFAKHSIHYSNLQNFFYIFSVWRDQYALSWKETEEYGVRLGLPVVPVLFQGNISKKELKDLCMSLDKDKQEGLVVRPASGFLIKEFPCLVGKFVRSNHVQTNKHWMSQPVVPNLLRKEND